MKTVILSCTNISDTAAVCPQALNKLDQIEVQLNSMDLPRNSTELAERHSQLSNAIVDVSTEADHEGRLLLERVSSVDPGADGVRRKVSVTVFQAALSVLFSLFACVSVCIGLFDVFVFV